MSRLTRLLLLPLAAMAMPAVAAPYIIFDPAAGTGTFGNSLVTTPTFEDTILLPTLTPGQSYRITGTITSSYSSGAAAQQNIDFTTVQLNGVDFDIGTTGRFEFRTISDTPSMAQNTLFVAGTAGNANSTPGGIAASYSGTLNIAAVPEPASWAMMVGGFGLLGFALRRQRRSGPALV